MEVGSAGGGVRWRGADDLLESRFLFAVSDTDNQRVMKFTFLNQLDLVPCCKQMAPLFLGTRTRSSGLRLRS